MTLNQPVMHSWITCDTLFDHEHKRVAQLCVIWTHKCTRSELDLTTTNCSSAKHWYCASLDIKEHFKLFQGETWILSILEYYRKLQTVPMQIIDTVHFTLFQCKMLTLCMNIGETLLTHLLTGTQEHNKQYISIQHRFQCTPINDS